jgi:3-hydroxybutyryl-CoA dehydrogenase
MPVVGVIGLGTMGSGIAQVAAQSGYTVLAMDMDERISKQSLASMEKRLRDRVTSGKMKQEELEGILRNINIVSSFQQFSRAEVVIEAVFERVEIKKEVLQKISDAVSEHALIGSNTSSISITMLSGAVRQPGRFIGLHFFNPVPVMKLVEIVKGYSTSDETVSSAKEFATSLGKQPVVVSDFPGFVSNRVLMPMINEAIFALMEGVAGVEEIDTIMKLGMHHPMGPLELADLIGLDVCLDIMNSLYSGFRDPKYRPCPLLEKMVNAGLLGRKSGRGFYTY